MTVDKGFGASFCKELNLLVNSLTAALLPSAQYARRASLKSDTCSIDMECSKAGSNYALEFKDIFYKTCSTQRMAFGRA